MSRQLIRLSPKIYGISRGCLNTASLLNLRFDSLTRREFYKLALTIYCVARENEFNKKTELNFHEGKNTNEDLRLNSFIVYIKQVRIKGQ